MSKYGVISGLYFPAFGLNTEIYGVNLRIQSEYRKIWTRNNSVYGYFSCSACLWFAHLTKFVWLNHYHYKALFQKDCWYQYMIWMMHVSSYAYVPVECLRLWHFLILHDFSIDLLHEGTAAVLKTYLMFCLVLYLYFFGKKNSFRCF